MTLKGKIQALAERVIRGHTRFKEVEVPELKTQLRSDRGRSCPDCLGALHRDNSTQPGSHSFMGSLALYCCGICGGSWILTVRH